MTDALRGLGPWVAAVAIAATVAACTADPVETPPPTVEAPAPMAGFVLDGTWERCHQLGACVYRLELTGPKGVETVDLEPVGAESGRLVPGPGFPARLALGSYNLTVVSTMLGDTLEPNGEQTVLGEEARCEAQFLVDNEMAEFTARVRFAPERCTVEVSSMVAFT